MCEPERAGDHHRLDQRLRRPGVEDVGPVQLVGAGPRGRVGCWGEVGHGPQDRRSPRRPACGPGSSAGPLSRLEVGRTAGHSSAGSRKHGPATSRRPAESRRTTPSRVAASWHRGLRPGVDQVGLQLDPAEAAVVERVAEQRELAGRVDRRAPPARPVGRPAQVHAFVLEVPLGQAAGADDGAGRTEAESAASRRRSQRARCAEPACAARPVQRPSAAAARPPP